MNHYQITSTTFSGFVDLFYDINGLLEKYDKTGADLSVKQQTWFLQSLPRTIDELKKLMHETATATLTEILPIEITFAMFWNRYDDKELSSKKKALAKWGKMPISEQQKAYNHIPKYFRSLTGGIRKKYAETYLNNELWNN